MADLNDLTFKYEAGSLRPFQKVMIMFKKLQMGHYLKQIESGSQYEIMEFDTSCFRRNIYFLKDNMSITMHPDNLNINITKNIIKTRENEERYTTKFDPYYLRTNFDNIKITAESEISLKNRQQEPIDMKDLTKKFEKILTGLKSFEEDYDLLYLLQPYVNLRRGDRNRMISELPIDIGLETFNRTVSPISGLFNKDTNPYPMPESLSKTYNMLESLVFHPKRLNTVVKFKDFSLHVVPKAVTLKYGIFNFKRIADVQLKQSFAVSNEVKLYTKLLEYMGCLDGLEMAAQKTAISNY